MPELPEVETIRRQLEPLVVGRRFGEAWAFPHPKFSPALEVSGAAVTSVQESDRAFDDDRCRDGVDVAPGGADASGVRAAADDDVDDEQLG